MDDWIADPHRPPPDGMVAAKVGKVWVYGSRTTETQALGRGAGATCGKPDARGRRGLMVFHVRPSPSPIADNLPATPVAPAVEKRGFRKCRRPTARLILSPCGVRTSLIRLPGFPVFTAPAPPGGLLRLNHCGREEQIQNDAQNKPPPVPRIWPAEIMRPRPCASAIFTPRSATQAPPRCPLRFGFRIIRSAVPAPHERSWFIPDPRISHFDPPVCPARRRPISSFRLGGGRPPGGVVPSPPQGRPTYACRFPQPTTRRATITWQLWGGGCTVSQRATIRSSLFGS